MNRRIGAKRAQVQETERLRKTQPFPALAGATATGADVVHVYQAQLWGQVDLLVVDEVQDSGGGVAVVQICGGAGSRCDESPDECCAGTTCNASTQVCQ